MPKAKLKPKPATTTPARKLGPKAKTPRAVAPATAATERGKSAKALDRLAPVEAREPEEAPLAASLAGAGSDQSSRARVVSTSGRCSSTRSSVCSTSSSSSGRPARAAGRAARRGGSRVGRRRAPSATTVPDPLQLLGRDVDAVQAGEHADDVPHRREHVLVEDDQVAAVAAHPVVDPARRQREVGLDHRPAERVRVVEHARPDRLVALLAEEDDRLLHAAEDVEARRVEALAGQGAVDQLVEPAQPDVRDVGLDRAEAVLLQAGVARVVLDPGEAVAVCTGARRLEPVAVDLVPVDDRVDIRPAVGDALRDRAAEDGDRGPLPVGLDVGVARARAAQAESSFRSSATVSRARS